MHPNPSTPAYLLKPRWQGETRDWVWVTVAITALILSIATGLIIVIEVVGVVWAICWGLFCGESRRQKALLNNPAYYEGRV